mgnify:CR=1 FL=1
MSELSSRRPVRRTPYSSRMGNHVSCDVVPLDDVLAYQAQPGKTPPPLRFREGLEVLGRAHG